MSRSRPLRLGILVIFVFAALFTSAALVAGVFWPADDAVAEETTDPNADLKSVSEGVDPEVSAAPVQTSGEPFRLCPTCHDDWMDDLPKGDNKLIFSHNVHIVQEVRCATCHERTLGHFSAPAPLMMTCLSCHEGDTAPNACKNCHSNLEEIAPGVDEPAVHLGTDVHQRETCAKCHDVDEWCEQCHGVAMPHPITWLGQHSKAAGRTGQDCAKCHQSQDQTFCIRCHGVDMPHPAYWYSNHGDVAENNPDSCDRCHPPAQDFCDACHHAGFDRTLEWSEEGHGAAVGGHGTSRCFVCHEQSYCEDCHQPGRFIKR
jgi:hypothetical protein